MPIYEFYCEDCNTIFKFLSRTLNTEKVPDFPRSRGHILARRVSMFATVSGSGGMDEEMPPIDESKMEKAMTMLEKEASGMNEDDPRQAAQLMRKLTEATGMKMNAGMEEALARMERGEDPDKIEEEMGDMFEGEEPFTFEGGGRKTAGRPRPEVDDTLYEM